MLGRLWVRTPTNTCKYWWQGSKRLSFHAGDQEVSRCCTRGESDESNACSISQGSTLALKPRAYITSRPKKGIVSSKNLKGKILWSSLARGTDHIELVRVTVNGIKIGNNVKPPSPPLWDGTSGFLSVLDSASKVGKPTPPQNVGLGDFVCFGLRNKCWETWKPTHPHPLNCETSLFYHFWTQDQKLGTPPPSQKIWDFGISPVSRLKGGNPTFRIGNILGPFLTILGASFCTSLLGATQSLALEFFEQN